MSLRYNVLRRWPLVMADGRNFRSFYYDTLGLKNVEQKKALEILLNSEEIDVCRVATFSSRFSLPAVFRSHVWKILLGITPSYQEAHSYVYQQRTEQYNDLHQALVTIRQIGPADQANPAEVVAKLFMMQEGLFRLIDIPKDQKRKLEILRAVVNVFVDMFEDPVDLYWLSVKFVGIQEHFVSHWDKLVKLIQHYIQAESNILWKHLNSFNAFEHMPYQRWFESSFAEDLPDSCMERIWDKVVAGSSRILGIVGAALLLVYKHSLMSVKESESMGKVLNQPCPEERCIIIVNKAMELWDKHGSTITSEAPTSH